ncbi:MAG: two-component system sensor histidine kinase BaeS, partial [Patiriisocius sp.]
MRIQSKLFATFLLSSVFLTVTLIAVIQWSIGKGMIDYVNAKELEALQPVRAALVQ